MFVILVLDQVGDCQYEKDVNDKEREESDQPVRLGVKAEGIDDNINTDNFADDERYQNESTEKQRQEKQGQHTQDDTINHHNPSNYPKMQFGNVHLPSPHRLYHKYVILGRSKPPLFAEVLCYIGE